MRTLARVASAVLFASACGSGAPAPPTTAPPPTTSVPASPLELSVGGRICGRSAGEVWCRGQGPGAASGLFARVPGIADAVTVDAGSSATCVVHAAGGVSCWGRIGEAETQAPAPVADVGDAVAVAVGDLEACARTRTGQVRCWGRSEGAWRATLLAGLSGVVEIAAGGHHGCARRDDGTVWCWGDDGLGALGRGDVASVVAPFAIDGVADAISLDAEWRHACALARSGAVTCWGQRAPASFRVEGGESIGVGAHHTCVRRRGGTVRCVGDADAGELGDGRDVVRGGAVDVAQLSGVTALAVSGGTSCALVGDAVSCWGRMPEAFRTMPAFRPVPRPLAGLALLGHAAPAAGVPIERVALAELPASEAPGSDSLRVRGLSVHQAARFVAQVRHASVLVAADASVPSVELALEAGSAEAALGAIATAAGLGVERWGSGPAAIYVIASTERLARARDVRVPALPSSRRLDVDFERASAAQVLALLSASGEWALTGALDGEVTITARGALVRDVGAALVRLAGATAVVRGSEVALTGGDLPHDAGFEPPPPCVPEAGMGSTALPCASPWRFWVGASAAAHGQAFVLLVGASGSAVVRQGDFVGRGEVTLGEAPAEMPVTVSFRVHAVTASGVVLTQEDPRAPAGPVYVRRLALGEPPAAPESLDGF